MPRKKGSTVPFSKLISCSHWPDAMQMLLDGTPVKEVAVFLQKHGEYADVKPKSLERVLYRWLRNVPPVQKISHVIVSDAISDLDLGVDALHELERVLAIQLGRVDVGLALEKRLNIILPTLGIEIERALKELRSYVRLLQDLGFQPKVPERVLVESIHLHGSVGNSSLAGRFANDLRRIDEKDVEALLRIERKLIGNGSE